MDPPAGPAPAAVECGHHVPRVQWRRHRGRAAINGAFQTRLRWHVVQALSAECGGRITPRRAMSVTASKESRTADAPATGRAMSRKAAASGWIGSALEYYDWFIYAQA